MNKYRCLFLIVVTATLTMGLVFSAASDFESDSEKIKIFVSILPQAYFVERIGGEHVDVDVMVGPGQSPATYEPTPHQMSDLEHTEIYFRIGVPFENQMLRKIHEIFRKLDMVDCQDNIELRRMADMAGHEDHGHGAYDPHTWLDPVAAITISQNIYEALVRHDSTHKDEYKNNLDSLLADLDNLHREIAAMLEPYAGRRFFVFHPVYGYFADRYNLRQTAVEVEGKEPSARQLAQFIDIAGEDSIAVIFVQPQFSTKTAEIIARSIGGSVVKIDPLAVDYIENLRNIAFRLAEGLDKK